jgi:hypothetical protein
MQENVKYDEQSEICCISPADGSVHQSSYYTDRALLVISTCKFHRGCTMQFGGSVVTSGRESGFCITTMHWATHRLLCSNYFPRWTFLSSPNHHSLQISLRVTFGCSLLWKWVCKGTHVATEEDIKSNALAEILKIPKEAFCQSFQQWQNWWRKCARAGSYFAGDQISVAICPTITVQYNHSSNFLTAHRSV